jgi:hypothetical protein
MKVLTKATALVSALFRGLGVELHPKVAASGVGASTAAVLLVCLGQAGVHLGAADQDTLAVALTILAGFLHPAD